MENDSDSILEAPLRSFSMQEPSELSNQTLRGALESLHDQNQRLKQHIVNVVHALPLGAMLLSGNGRIVTQNAQASSFMAGVDWSQPRKYVQEVWGQLGWPSVPFQEWEWEEGWLSCWECPIEVAPRAGALRLRFLKNTPFHTKGEEVIRQRWTAIGEMSGRLAHDIRNPLASIEWFATLLERADPRNADFKELIRYLLQAIQTMKRLMGNLLTFSHECSMYPHEVNLAKFMGELEKSVSHLLHKKNVSMNWYVAPNLQQIVVDETLFQRAIQNIMLNAIQASDSDGRIDIRAWREVIPEGAAHEEANVEGFVLSVQDYGCGMTSEEVDKVFHPFYTNRKGGTGLGLSIVKQVIQIHQGLITLTSEKGNGTVVRLFFPQKRSEA